MRRFSARTQDGRHVLGLALTQDEIERLIEGGQLVIDLQRAHVGLWDRNAKGEREFSQFRNSFVLLMGQDSDEALSEALGGVEFPSAEEINRAKT